MSEQAGAPAGSAILLGQVMRSADLVLSAIASTRARARNQTTAAALALTVALAVSSRADTANWAEWMAGAAIVCFVAIAVLAAIVDWPRRQNSTPNLQELREHVDSREWDEAWIAWWTASAYLEKVTAPNASLMNRLANVALVQLILLVAETLLLAGVLFALIAA